MLDVAGVLASQIYRRQRARLFRRLGRPVDGPWMLPREEDLVSECLRSLQPMRALEWGAGGSTLVFPRLLPTGGRWLALEHDLAWAASLGTKALAPGVEIVHVAPDRAPWTGDGADADFRAYLDFPSTRAPFDFILVDGRARAGALAACPKLLAPGGVMVLHDANRASYRVALPDVAHQALFLDARVRARRVAGGIWIGSADRPVATLVDVELHRRVWSVYRALRART